MAAITESIALYSSSSSRAYLQPTSTSWPCLSVSFGRTCFPGFRGLRFQSSPNPKVSHLSSTPAIVSQSPDTAVDIPTVNDKTWKSLVLNADGPVLVEFWASWCGPCRMIHPVVGEIANEYTGKLNCFRVSTDDSPSIATRYGIRSVPTIVIFIKGEKKDAVIGVVPKTTLTAIIEKYL